MVIENLSIVFDKKEALKRIFKELLWVGDFLLQICIAVANAVK